MRSRWLLLLLALAGSMTQAAVKLLTPILPARLAFEPNAGQADRGISFIAGASGYRVAFSPEAVTIQLTGTEIQLRFVGGRPATFDALDRLPGIVNYLTGTSPEHWLRRIPTYSQLRARNIYSGVDVVYRSTEGRLEYDLILAPGADVSRIRMRFDGARRVRIDQNGDIVLDTATGELRQKLPLIYQARNGARVAIAGHYVLTAHREIALALRGYDRRRPLVIDPELVYASKLKRQTAQQVTAMATDSQGNIYVTSTPVDSVTYPIIVSKLDPSGQNVIYTTHIGSNGLGTGIAVDQAGSAYVTGWADPKGFPVTAGAFQVAGTQTAFISKLSAAGDALVYSALVAEVISMAGIAVDGQGNAYIAGTAINGVPVTGNAYWSTPPVQPPCCGGFGPSTTTVDGFVLKLNPAGSDLSYATYANQPVTVLLGISGAPLTAVSAIAVDSTGDAHLTGGGFVLKFNSTGSDLLYSAQISGVGQSIAIDSSANAYITGQSYGSYVTGFPSTAHAFVTKLDPKGNLVFDTSAQTLASEGTDSGQGIAVDAAGNIFVAGTTISTSFPLRNPVQEAFSYETGFLTELDSAGHLLFSTYVGDTSYFQIVGLILDPAGKPVLCGNASGSFGPVTSSWLAKYDTSGVSTLRLDSIANLASQLAVPVSPGELVVINGTGFGDDLQLFFNSVPATMIPGAPKPTAIVPYALDGKTFAVAHVESGGQKSNDVQIPVSAAAPGIFTADGSGTGQALAFNEDGSQNSPAHPAAKGTWITFYVTGAGQTVPPGVDGVLLRSTPARTVLPFSVWIGDWYVPGFHHSVGPAPGFPADVVQVQARIPEAFSPPSFLTVVENGTYTQQGVTISIAP